ncbi:MAG: CapA family protein [Eubacterium sp.]|nr:CapA family protein [Eubacterium sp.]
MNTKRKVGLGIIIFVIAFGVFWITPLGAGVSASSGETPTTTGTTAPAASVDPSAAPGETTDPSATPAETQVPDPTVAPIETPAPVETATPKPTAAPSETVAPEPTSEVASFTFTASGDDLVHSCLYEQAAARGKAKGKKYDFSYCYKDVKKYFKKKDLNWINQETLVNSGYTPSGYPTFSTPTQIVKDLRKLNFTVFNTSSNHSYDKLAGGLDASMKFWKEMKKKEEGKDCYQVGICKRSNPLPQLIRKVNGIKVGFLSYTYGTNGISISSNSKYRVVYLSERDRIKKQVKKLRKKADVVIVSCHWGVENSHTISAEQKSLAKDLTSWGADLIIGTHPHVLQDCGWVKSGNRKAFCAYSLGNFISGQVQTNQILGGTLNCTIKVNRATGKVKIAKPRIKPNVTVYGSNRSNIHVKWLEDYDSSDAAVQSSHISQSSFKNLAKKIIKNKYLDL